MNRLQKKCVVFSSALHLLLLLVLVVGPGFVSSTGRDYKPAPLLDFTPVITTDEQKQGGGSPTGGPPPPVAPPTPTPRPPEPAPAPTQARTEPAPAPVPATRPTGPIVSTDLVRRPRPGAKALARARAEQEAQQDAQWRREVASAVGRTASGISSSGTTSLELKGPGGGGVPYANFDQAVVTAYTRAWLVPDGILDKNATVETLVVIARDGTVVSARITRSSGNAELDASVRRAFDRVQKVPPLPATSRESQREVPINFNANTKLGLG
jgi:TonB family protein